MLLTSYRSTNANLAVFSTLIAALATTSIFAMPCVLWRVASAVEESAEPSHMHFTTVSWNTDTHPWNLILAKVIQTTHTRGTQIIITTTSCTGRPLGTYCPMG
jgi:hypothetical protein